VLSLTQCRELLGGDLCQLSDSELEAVRDQMYRLGRLALEVSSGVPNDERDRADG
jgi:hypothetical protein